MAQLSEQQRYLLGRLPGKFDLENPVATEPSDVRNARKIIAAFTDKVDKRNNERKKEFNKAIAVAREAIYFKPPGDALKVVRDLEAEFPEAIK